MTRHKILIVDDEVQIRVMLARMIEPLEYEISLAEDGQAAYEMLQERGFDLIISDLKMPRMDGLTLLEKIRGDGIDSAFIILTGHGDLPQALQARERFNISNFLVKPVHNMDQFLFDVDSAITRRSLEKENQSLMEQLRESNTELEQKVRARTRELVEKNDELARLSNFRGDVLRVMGHEFRTPLAILAGYHFLSSGQGLRNDAKVAASMGKSIKRLQEKVEKALHLLKGSNLTRFPLELEETDPRELCRRVIERIAPLIDHRRIEIRTAFSPPCNPCRWDREKMEAVVEELLLNAVRATPDQSSIELGVSDDGEAAVIWVRDYGKGIPRDQFERIFEPFVTLGKPLHHMSGSFELGAEGIGLGLSTARMWVGLHEGTLSAQPNPEGPGTMFTARVPREGLPIASQGHPGSGPRNNP